MTIQKHNVRDVTEVLCGFIKTHYEQKLQLMIIVLIDSSSSNFQLVFKTKHNKQKRGE